MTTKKSCIDYQPIADEFSKTRYENPIKSTAIPELKVPLMEVVDYQTVSKEYQSFLRKNQPWVIRE